MDTGSTLEARPVKTETGRSIPSLDGLRAVSILVVILAHSAWSFPHAVRENFLFRNIINNGVHGVVVFFVISGYLITTLLLRETRKTGTVSLGHFYFRRSMRIFPPFYVYLAVVAILAAYHLLPPEPLSFAAAATYTWSVIPGCSGYVLTHTWSLSVEEIFYLVWPLMVFALHRKGDLVKACQWIILLAPLIRLGFYFAFPDLRGYQYQMVQGWFDTMMVGCLLALLKFQGRWDEIHRRWINGWTALVMFVVAFILMPYLGEILPRKLAGISFLLISPTVTAFCVGGILMYCITDTHTLTARILNSAVLRYIGIRSYSLYLWQQIFMWHRLEMLPLGYLYAFAATEASYWLVEKPSLRLRAWLETRHG